MERVRAIFSTVARGRVDPRDFFEVLLRPLDQEVSRDHFATQGSKGRSYLMGLGCGRRPATRLMRPIGLSGQ